MFLFFANQHLAKRYRALRNAVHFSLWVGKDHCSQRKPRWAIDLCFSCIDQQVSVLYLFTLLLMKGCSLPPINLNDLATVINTAAFAFDTDDTLARKSLWRASARERLSMRQGTVARLLKWKEPGIDSCPFYAGDVRSKRYVLMAIHLVNGS